MSIANELTITEYIDLQLINARSMPRFIAAAVAILLAVAAFALLRLSFATPAHAADLFDGGSDQARITGAVKRAGPSVVALEVYVGGTRYVPIDPFGDTAPQAVQGRASGSGFVYDSSGTIVTNAHVVSPPSGGHVEKIDVLFANGDRIAGRVAAVDRDADLALVRVDNYAKLPPALTLADSKKIVAGQWAIAIGEPLELRQTVTVGVVSGFDRSEPISDESGSHVFSGLLQTSAPINPGNSGGPLIDMDGRVIGINQSVAGGAQGIGFAIPVDTISAKVAAMLGDPSQSTSDATKPDAAFVGVRLVPLDTLPAQNRFEGEHGVAVSAVSEASPAARSGIKAGDIIVAIDGKNVDSPQSAADAIRARKPGDTIAMSVATDGVERAVAVRAGAPQIGMELPATSDDSNGDATP
jgi:serine protease Do